MIAARPLRVALDLPLRTGDSAFTYASRAAEVPPRGAGVIVPFGKRLMPGIVLDEGTPRDDLRPILTMATPAPLVPSATVDLAEWTAAEYLSTIGEALSVALPWEALWAGARLRCRDPIPADLSEPVRSVLDGLGRRPVSLARAGRLLAAAGDALDPVARARALAVTLPAVDRLTRLSDDRPEAAASAFIQARPAELESSSGAAGRLDAAVREALESGPRAILVAGWHRTPAYLAAIRRARAAGWSTLAMFASVDAAVRFAAAAMAAGLAPVLLHGDLAPAARLAAWWSLIGAHGSIVVGTRGAVFAPVPDPVLAIVDDEDSSGHKEERAPRYLTGAVAAGRTRGAGILVVGSATPTVATYAAAQSGAMRLVALPSPRPRLGVIDLRRRADPEQPVSRPVLDAVRRTIRRGGRAVLLADRKGYAGALHCTECGAVDRCPQCGVAMSYDRRLRRLHCRICGRTVEAPHVCSRCGAARLAPLGAGTDRVAAAIRRVTAAVWRLDSDVLKPGGDAGAVLAPFRDRGGVLVATSLVLPLLEDLRPDLVAVVSADRWLHRPEFRAAERALALLRTIGIAARGQVLVETTDVNHPAIRAATAPSLRPFYADELALREALGYPPFRSLLAIIVASASAAPALEVAARLAQGAPASLEVLGPSPQPGLPSESLQGRTAGSRFRYEIVLKAVDRAAARDLVLPLLIGRGVPRGVRVSVDVDPHEL
jgi:primosomal protein N' (replication factor Y)